MKKEKPFVTHMPIHEIDKRNSVEEEAEDILENSIQRPQRHGERADTFALEDMMDVKDDYEEDDKEEDMDKKNCPMKDKKRMDDNVDNISETIMDIIDAVDAGEDKKIKTIMIEIGLE